MTEETTVKIVFPTKELAEQFINHWTNNAELKYSCLWTIEGSNQAYGTLYTKGDSESIEHLVEPIKILDYETPKQKRDRAKKFIQDKGNGFE